MRNASHSLEQLLRHFVGRHACMLAWLSMSMDVSEFWRRTQAVAYR
ncbi:hypothetical protein CSB95_2791 [Pseudomonas aeruginosa]|nr:hypothetical protein CSC29_2988 [Pseudomonas aeruginosa]ESZ83282.1 hypothetical protein V441_10950 [Pseudomonas aeruginosa DHS29]PRW08692.1 hypothetical protein CSB95_2791 [Pseudomonas aeruginosa]